MTHTYFFISRNTVVFFMYVLDYDELNSFLMMGSKTRYVDLSSFCMEVSILFYLTFTLF